MGGKQVMPDLEGFSHIDLTVSDCEAAATWWQDVIGSLINRSRGDNLRGLEPIDAFGFRGVGHDS